MKTYTKTWSALIANSDGHETEPRIAQFMAQLKQGEVETFPRHIPDNIKLIDQSYAFPYSHGLNRNGRHPMTLKRGEAAQKVVAYITCRGHLLVFKQPNSPEAGIQVPAGTIDPGESPAEAVLREAREETGLDGLAIRSFLGAREVELQRSAGERARVRRHYFHLQCETADVTRRWIHMEQDPSEGAEGPIPFELYWVKYPHEVPRLSGSLDEILAMLQPDDI